MLLYEKVQQLASIRILLGHKAKSVDLGQKTLTCENTVNGEEKMFQPVCLVLADGYKSKARDLLAQQLPDKSLRIQQWPWNVSFRVLVSEPDVKTDLDPGIHYIYNEVYVAKFRDGRWTAVIGIRDNAPTFLSSYDAGSANVEALKNYLKKICPPALQLISDDEFKR